MNASPVLLLLFLLSSCHGGKYDDSPASGILATTKAQRKTETPLEVSCPEPSDIKPCKCLTQFDLFMDCSEVQDEEELRKVFSAFFPSTNFSEFYMSLNKGVKVLEDGVFGTVSFKMLRISDSVLETVMTDALTPSLTTLTSIHIEFSDLATFPFERLDEFTSLNTLYLISNKIHSVPTLSSSSLVNLFLGTNRIQSLPSISSSSLHTLQLSENPISRLSSDVFTLIPDISAIYLEECNLTEIIPGTFRGLPNLNYLDLNKNNISYLQSLTFDLVSGPSGRSYLMLDNNNIDFVEVDAFKGVAGSAVIDMKNNALTTLKEEVWRPVLEKGIDVKLQGNSLSCDCDVAWLVRDTQLLMKANDARCADGTLLMDLDPADFDHCA